MIRAAKLSEIPDILQLTKACAISMQNQGIYQWNEHYPTKIIFEEDIAANELYTLEIDNEIMGTIVISTKVDAEYVPLKWLTPNSNNIYIHRLAIHPKIQGKGHAQKLMDFGEDYALKNGFVSVRLDTFSQNKRNQKLYEKRGYKRLGNIYFPKQSEHPFYCYELVL